MLDELALKYGTDKGSHLHNYTRWYFANFPKLDANITLLEIGVAQGKSLRMWRDYYINANIAGLDINECQPVEGVKIFKGDQSDPNVLKTVIESIGSPDVVIDDGSHLWKDQIASFKLLWPHVKPGGVYVIEDVHTSFDMGFGEPGGLTALQFLHNLMDNVSHYGAGGLGDIRNCEGYNEVKSTFNIYQNTIESMIFYPSICFVRKNAH